MIQFAFRKVKDYAADEDGATAVEFGVLAIAFISILFGIIEMGRLFLTWNGLQYVIESAARTALADEDITSAELETQIENQLGTYTMSPDNLELNITFPVSGDVNFVQIEGTYAYNVIVPFLPDSWDDLELTAKSRLPRPE
jgi:Flp pilus assembly protein TadG